MELTFTLDQFSGPLDLLLHLISKSKVSIEDIPIAEILDQYMDYLGRCPDFDSETSSEFIIMAAQLILIKSKLLLPKPSEDAEDPRAELADALREYQKCKETAAWLNKAQSRGIDLYSRPQEPLDCRSVTYVGSLNRLIRTMDLMLLQNGTRAPADISRFEPIINVNYVSIESSMGKLLKKVLKGGDVSFDRLMVDAESRSEIVAIFLAVLELSRLKKISVSETENGYFITCRGEKDE